jgi:hypothetical protein
MEGTAVCAPEIWKSGRLFLACAVSQPIFGDYCRISLLNFAFAGPLPAIEPLFTYAQVSRVPNEEEKRYECVNS